jgi:hypothetical protein
MWTREAVGMRRLHANTACRSAGSRLEGFSGGPSRLDAWGGCNHRVLGAPSLCVEGEHVAAWLGGVADMRRHRVAERGGQEGDV